MNTEQLTVELPMHFAIDVREAGSSRKTGKGQWTWGFIEELKKRDMKLTLLGNGSAYDDVSFSSGWKWHLQCASWLKKARYIDAYISPTSYIVPALLGSKVPCIPIVHDLIAFQRGKHDRKARLIERCFLGKALKGAVHVCTVSETTKRDLLTRFSWLNAKKVTSIFSGPMVEHPPANTTDGKTILCAGTLCPRKNQLRLIQAYQKLPSSLRSEYRLLLVGGRGWSDREIVDLAQTTEGVEWRDYVTDEEYRSLLGSCAVFALPSLYEGFGMQVLDALQRGIPVLTSDKGSLAEIAGDAAVVACPEDVDSIKEQLERILTDSSLRLALRDRGPQQASKFRWKKTVNLFQEAIESTV